MIPYILAIDSGNTFVKWGLFNGEFWIKKNKIYHTQLAELQQDFLNIPEPNIIVISHVSSEIIRDQIEVLISRWSVKPYWVMARSFQCGISNGYSNPLQLGSDRWAALIAAREYQNKACLVINVGTAMTIDALSDSGHFLGGLIAPGTYMMINGLQSATQLMNIEAGIFHDFPQNTNDAIHSGVIQCLVGAIERMYSSFARQLEHPLANCIISGGGAHKLMPFINVPIVFIDNLVLEGLAIIGNDLQLNKNYSL